VKVAGVRARDVLSFEALDVDFDSPLTVIVGPNGVGKTNVGRLIDICALAVHTCATGGWTLGELVRDYSLAGRDGAERWQASVGLELTTDEERELVADWVRGCVLSQLSPNSAAYAATPDLLDYDLGEQAVFAHGRVEVSFDRALRHPWRVSWHGGHSGETYALDLWNSSTLRRDGDAGTSRNEPVDLLLRHRLEALREVTDDRQTVLAPGPTLADLTGGGNRLDMVLRPVGGNEEAPSVRRVLRALGLEAGTSDAHAGLARVLDHLLVRSLAVTANRRDPAAGLVSLEALRQPPDLRTGAGVAVGLWQDKNGGAADRARLARTQEIFATLTGARLDVVSEPQPDSSMLVTAVVPESRGATGPTHDVPLRLSGAGREEAAHLSLLLAGDLDVVLLDEPATNLSPAAQATVLGALRARATVGRQTIVITHSPSLVPLDGPADLRHVLRMTRGPAGQTRAHRLRGTTSGTVLTRTLRLNKVREALFANGVLLVEGPSDEVALELWLSNPGTGLPTPAGEHVSILAVSGHQDFPAYAQVLDDFAVPRAMLADGPAMRAGGPLDKLPDSPPNKGGAADTIGEARTRWAPLGVHTLADDFHDDGSKAGEIEAFFDRVDHETWTRTLAANGASHKPPNAAAFAGAVPAPQELLDLWSAVLRHLGR